MLLQQQPESRPPENDRLEQFFTDVGEFAQSWHRQVKQFVGTLPRWSKILSFILLITVSFYYILAPNGESVFSATYTFSQSSWSGGTNVATASHPGDQTGWNKYTSGTNVFTTGTSTVTIASSTYSATDDGTFTTDGIASGGDFGNGTTSNTTVSGSGSGASVSLATNGIPTLYHSSGTFTSATLDLETARMNSITISSTTPSGVGADPVRIQFAANNDDSTWNYIGPDGTSGTYFTTTTINSIPASIREGKRYWRYKVYLQTNDTALTPSFNSITFNFSSITSSAITTTSDDAALSSDGTATGGGFGNGTSSNTVVSSGSITLTAGLTYEAHQITRLASTPLPMQSSVWDGTSDYIFAAREYMYRYSISNNTWTQLGHIPGGSGTFGGAAMVHAAGEDNIYAVTGNDTNEFVKFYIPTSTWSSLANIPTSTGQFLRMVRYGTEDSIYLMPDVNNTTTFYKYSISNNQWTNLASAPTISDIYHNYYQLSRLTNDDYIYYTAGGGGAPVFYRYSISGNFWTTLNAQNGTQLVRTDSDEEIYSIKAGGDVPTMRRYSTNGNTWTDLASGPSGANDWAGMVGLHFPSSDYIYNLGPYSDNHIYRYTLSTNVWTTVTNTLAFGLSTENSNGPHFSADGNTIYFILNSDSTTTIFKDTINTNLYDTSGDFTSATIDMNVAKFQSISWTSSTPTGVGSTPIKFQIAGNNDNSTWNYVGPDGTNSTYFSTSGGTTFPASLNSKRYIRYKAFLTTADQSVTPTLDSVTFTYTTIGATGTLISSAYDTADPTNIVARIAWTASNTGNTSVKFQLRSAASSGALSSATWVGPDGTSATYFTTASGETPNTSMMDGNGDRYVQYQAFLISTSPSDTPTLSNATVTYVVNAAPEIQNVTATPNTDGTVTIAYQVRDPDTSTGTYTPGYVTPSFQYCINHGSCQTITTIVGGISNVAVDAVNWTSVTSTWRPAADFPSQYSTLAEVKVIVNDNEAANNTANGTSADFTLDTGAPSGNSVVVDASSTPALVTLAATDTSTIYVHYALSTGALNSAQYYPLVSPTSTTFASPTDVLYAQFKDYYGNSTTLVSVALPTKPANMYIHDVSDTNNSVYRLFLAWTAVSDVNFASYKIYRSTDQYYWTLIGTQTTITNNYFADSTALQGVTYYYRVTTVDTNGNQSFASNSISGKADGVQNGGESTASAAPPTITNVASANVSATFATITWDTDSLSSSTVSYSTNPGEFSTQRSVGAMADNNGSVGRHVVVLSDLTPNTTYYFQVLAEDVINGLSSTSTGDGGNGYSFTTANGPTISNVSVAKTYNSQATITWDTDTLTDATVYYSTNANLDSPATAVSTSLKLNHTVELTGLTPGTQYFFYVKSTDQSAVSTEDKNVVDNQIRYYLLNTSADAAPPGITDISTQSQTSTVAIYWKTSEEATGQVAYGTSTAYGTTTTLDSTLSVEHYATITGLTNATAYHYRIYASDANGNSSFSTDQTVSTAVQADTTAPVVSGITTSSVSLTGATITFSTNEDASGIVEYGTDTSYGSISGNPASYTTGLHTITLTNLTGNTRYYFRVRATDFAGNVTVNDNSGDGYQFTTVADTTAPTISNITTQVTTSSIYVYWTTNETADSQVDYGATAGYGSQTTLDTTLTIQHSAIISGIANNTTYHFRVRATDASGNLALSSDQTATTLSVGDLTAPTVSNIQSSGVTLSGATITWDTNEGANELVEYGTDNTYGLVAGSPSNFSRTSHTVTLSGLSGNTTYHYRIRSADASGNTTVDDNNGNTYTFTTQADTTAPSISNVTAQTTASTITITWSTDELANSRIDYGTTNSYGSQTPLDSTLTIQHSVTITGLADATTYHYRIRTVDGSGNIGLSSDYTATTGAIADTTAPVITSVTSNSISLTGATITWTTDEGANELVEYGTDTGYGSVAGSAGDFSKTSHSVNITGLTGNTTYYYRVRSTDISGNTRIADNSGAGYTFTTAADTTEPTISNIVILANTSTLYASWTTNENASTQIDIGTTVAYGSQSTLDSTQTIQHSVLYTGLTPNTTYHVRLRSRDPSNNLALSSDQTITTLNVGDTTAPSVTSVATSTVSLTGATVTWTTDEYANEVVEYGTTAGAYDTLAGSLSNYSNTSHSIGLTNLTANTVYYFRVRSADLSGNTTVDDNGGAGYQFTTSLDATPPVISNLQTTVVNDSSVTIVWNTDKAANSVVHYGVTTGLGSTQSLSSRDTTHVITLTGLAKKTTYYFNVASTDASNNSTTDDNGGAQYSFSTSDSPGVTQPVEQQSGGRGNVSVEIDSTPPALLNVTIKNVSSTEATVTWDTPSETSNSLVQYGKTIAYGKLAGDYTNRVAKHSVTLTDLVPGTTYHVQALSADAAGNLGQSAPLTFATLNANGTVAPIAETEKAPQAEPTPPPETKPLELQLSTATREQLDKIFAALAANPNITEEVFLKAVQEMANKFVKAPAIVGPEPKVEVVGSVAIVTWTTDKNSNSVVLYAAENDFKPKLDNPYSNAATNPDEFSTEHRVVLSGLEAGTRYHYIVVSKGSLGPEARSFDHTFSTAVEPPKINNITVQRTDERTATLAWQTNVPTAATVAYTNGKSGEKLTQGDTSLVKDHVFTIKNLETGINYTAVITVVDENGSTAESVPIAFTTLRDSNAPLIKNVNAESTLFPGQTARVQAVISWDTDEPATSQVFYQEGFSSSSTVAIPIDDLSVLKHVVVLAKLKPGSVYRYWVESRDVAGNLSRSEIFSMLTAQERETIIDVIIKNFDQVFGWTKHISIGS